MPGAWRWTLGLVTLSFYTILPDRLFAGLVGGDHYNPYTNTVSIYSDLRPVGLHEGGHARDFAEVRNRHWRGIYAAIRILPLVPLWQEGAATSDVLSWEKTYGEQGDERSAYRKLFPAYGSYVGGEISRWLPTTWIVYAVQYGAVVVGHAAGQTRALFVGERPEPDPLAPLDALERARASGPPQRCPGPAPAPGGDPLEPEPL